MSPRARLACLAVAGGAVVLSGVGVASADTDAPTAAGFLIPPAPGHDPADCGMVGGSVCYVLQWADVVLEVLLPG